MLTLNLSPYPVLNTARLQLRCITHNDAPALYKLRTDPEVLKYLDRAPMGSLQEAHEFIDLLLNQWKANENILWVITFKDDPLNIIGTIGYWKFAKEHYRAEIGYMLSPLYWGKGIMQEALLKVIDYAFREIKLHSIEANINPGNAASEALLIKCGFIKEGYFRESYYYNGTFSDAAIYSLVSKI